MTWYLYWGFTGGLAVKSPSASAGDIGDMGSIPGLGRSPGKGNGDPFHYYCLKNPMVREAWLAVVQGVAKNQTLLSEHTCAISLLFFIGL